MSSPRSVDTITKRPSATRKAATGLFGFIPFFGFLTGLILSVGVAIVQFWPDWTMIAATLGIFIFGQFIEHLGRCIYGGIWAEMRSSKSIPSARYSSRYIRAFW